MPWNELRLAFPQVNRTSKSKYLFSKQVVIHPNMVFNCMYICEKLKCKWATCVDEKGAYSLRSWLLTVWYNLANSKPGSAGKHSLSHGHGQLAGNSMRPKQAHCKLPDKFVARSLISLPVASVSGKLARKFFVAKLLITCWFRCGLQIWPLASQSFIAWVGCQARTAYLTGCTEVTQAILKLAILSHLYYFYFFVFCVVKWVS